MIYLRTKVVSNKKQLERLVRLMEENSDIAKGLCVKSQAKSRWEQFAAELNSLGPPIRTWEKWIKVWSDLKFKIRKKKAENNAEMRKTGGGPNKLHKFTAIEDAVIDLLNINQAICPAGREFGVSVTEISEINLEHSGNSLEEARNEHDVSMQVDESASNDVQNKAKRRSRKNAKQAAGNMSTDRRLELLERQTMAQECFQKELTNEIKEMKEGIKSISDYTKKIYYLKKEKKHDFMKIKKEKLGVYKEDIENKKRDRIARLKLKIEILELTKKGKQFEEPDYSGPL